MAIATTTGDKGKADKLFSKIIRFPGACANCEYECPPECSSALGEHRKGCKLQCAHLVSRLYSATRCDVRNAFPLCAKCHHFFTNWPLEFHSFVMDHRSPEEYASLRQRALKGAPKFDWTAEVERLTEVWAGLKDWDF